MENIESTENHMLCLRPMLGLAVRGRRLKRRSPNKKRVAGLFYFAGPVTYLPVRDARGARFEPTTRFLQLNSKTITQHAGAR